MRLLLTSFALVLDFGHFHTLRLRTAYHCSHYQIAYLIERLAVDLEIAFSDYLLLYTSSV